MCMCDTASHLRLIGEIAPSFEADTTQGKIKFRQLNCELLGLSIDSTFQSHCLAAAICQHHAGSARCVPHRSGKQSPGNSVLPVKRRQELPGETSRGPADLGQVWRGDSGRLATRRGRDCSASRFMRRGHDDDVESEVLKAALQW